MWQISDVLEGCGGSLKGGPTKKSRLPEDRIFQGFSIDTRSIRPQALFIALSGPRFDGHDFVATALEKGGYGAIVAAKAFEEKKSLWQRSRKDALFILVDDPLTALQSLAAWHRQRFRIPVIGISGSNGKTTTKEMIASILETQGPLLKNEGNLNNHIGLPLTLLRLEESHQAAVVEMGISGRGEMARLSEIARPTLGLLTNIGPAHLEGLDSLEGVSAEKTLLFKSVHDSGGTAVINLEDPFLKPWKEAMPKAWSFGLDQVANLSADNIRVQKRETLFRLRRNRGPEKEASLEVSLPVPGQHQVMNALAAAAATSALGVDLGVIAGALSRFRSPAQRGDLFEAEGITLLFDAYNANPASVEAALDLLVLQKTGQGERIALLGDMLELGPKSSSAHREIGRSVARRGIERLIAVGEFSEVVAEGARQGGMGLDQISSFSDLKALRPELKTLVQKGAQLLIKGSRGMRLEQLLPLFGRKEGG